jgi:hypothetical protein
MNDEKGHTMCLGITCVLLFLGGCGQSNAPSANTSATVPEERNSVTRAPVTQSDWAISEVHSAIDGDRLSVQKDFQYQNRGLVRAILACARNKRKLAMSLESYGNDGDPSPLVNKVEQDSTGQFISYPQGRIKLATANDPLPMDQYFSLAQYNNVATWDVSLSALASDGEAKASAKDFKAKTERGQALIGSRMGVILGAAMTGHTSKQDVASLQRTFMAFWTEDNYEDVFGDGSAGLVDSGKYLKSQLPLAGEVINSQGTIEVQIPDGDPNIEQVVKACSLPADVERATRGEEVVTPSSSETAAQSQPIAETERAVASNQPLAATGQPKLGDPNSNGRLTEGPNTGKPSFDCGLAHSQVEHLICGNSDLANEDAAMAALYRQKLSDAANVNPDKVSVVRAGQRSFLSKRNRCSSVECIAESYRARWEEMAQMGYVRE